MNLETFFFPPLSVARCIRKLDRLVSLLCALRACSVLTGLSAQRPSVTLFYSREVTPQEMTHTLCRMHGRRRHKDAAKGLAYS